MTVAATTYETARDIARDGDAGERRALAMRSDPPPEVLYYLVADRDPAVRRALAANPATPAQADALLALDVDPEVRAELARKIGRLLPDMAEPERMRVRERALATLARLAEDEATKVRSALAEAIKRSAHAPKAVVLKLAADLAAEVAAPVLEYSPLLSDVDLLEIVAHGQLHDRLSAIARRRDVSGVVADAIAATCDVSAVAALLANPRAQIREETLDALVGQARDVAQWHEPLTMRPELSQRAMRRIAGFVASALVDQLVERNGLPETFAAELRSIARQAATGPVDEEGESAMAKARALHAAGALTEAELAEAIDRNDRPFIMAGLAVRSGVALDAVQRAFGTRSAKAITAITWSCGYSMRLALKLQVRVALIPARGLLQPRGGDAYPLSEEELRLQLDVLGAA